VYHQTLPGGLDVIVAPPSPTEAAGVVAEVVSGALPLVSQRSGRSLFVDLGSSYTTTTASVAAQAELVVVVVRQHPRSRGATVAQCVRAAELARHIGGVPAAALVVGSYPIRPAEISDFLGIPTVGVLDDDPVAAAQLAGAPGSPSRNANSRLLRSARCVSASLHGVLDGSHSAWRAPEAAGVSR
jgi:hypothetical protein